jgi:hypothetical protein
MSKRNRNPGKNLGTNVIKSIDRAGEQIERAQAAGAESKQPRFAIDRANVNKFFQQIYGVAKDAIFNEPPYVADSSRRDAWLAKVVRKEPYLLGILQSVVSIDKNRGWTLVGGKIQVKKFVNVLHNFQVAPDLFGWRNGTSVSAQNYYQSDMGAVVEIGRSMVNGPLAALFTVDPTKCHLTGNIATPLKYNNGAKDKQMWEPTDYFRVTSFPSPSESMNGLGLCAVSRCLELAKLLVSVFEHDREKLGSKAPKGILTINGGLTLDQWLQSLEESSADLKSLEREYYSGVQVLVGEVNNEIKVSLTPLSSLPEDFDQEQFANMIIYGYALAFGYDPREFWPVSAGGLGTGRETEEQHRKATSKGGLDFALGFQEKLQDELPETLEFEFESRDVQGDIAEVDFKKKQLEIIDQMYQSVNARQETLVTYSEARQLLVDAKLIPEGWTPEDEDVQVADTDDMTALVEKQRVQNALAKFPDDDIVVYDSPSNKYRTLRKAGQKKFMIGVGRKPRPEYRLKKKMNMRAERGSIDSIRSNFTDVVYTVVRDYLNSSDRSTSYKSAMGREVVEAYAYAAERGYEDGGGELPLDGEVMDWLTASQDSERANVDSLFVSLKLLRDSGEFDADAEATARANGYTNSLDGIYNKAVLFGIGNQMLTFEGDDGIHSCPTCTSLKGQRHKASWWISHDYVPPTGDGLDCAAGGHCMHQLVDDQGTVVTV